MGVGLERTALGGLARVAMAQRDLATALGHVEGLMAGPQPDVAAPDTTSHPELVALTCHVVPARAGDRRAAAWSEQARVLLDGGQSHSGCGAAAGARGGDAASAGDLGDVPRRRPGRMSAAAQA